MSRICSCNMNEYLKTTIQKLTAGNYATLHIVLGNESCDLDSAVSAVCYAAFLSWQHQQLQCKVCTRNKRTEEVKDDIFVPLLNVSREDYEIKTEVAYVFQSHGLNKEDLIFKDDPFLPNPLKANIILVDHHVLSAKDKHLSPYVSEIIDHRPIDKTNWCYKEDTRSTIEVVGSCATLVVQRIRDLCSLLAKDDDFFVNNIACCDMLHSTIILDTVNCSKEVDKATPRDEEVLLFLETILKVTDRQTERATKLESLVRSRRDVSSLSPLQLLRKDAKMLGDVLIPSFPMLVKVFLSRPGALDAVSEAVGRGIVVLLLGMELAGGLERDMAVYCTDDAARDRLCAFLQEWIPSLDLCESPDQLPDLLPNKSLRYFTQRNLSASRKQYIPAIQAFLNIDKQNVSEFI